MTRVFAGTHDFKQFTAKSLHKEEGMVFTRTLDAVEVREEAVPMYTRSYPGSAEKSRKSPSDIRLAVSSSIRFA